MLGPGVSLVRFCRFSFADVQSGEGTLQGHDELGGHFGCPQLFIPHLLCTLWV